LTAKERTTMTNHYLDHENQNQPVCRECLVRSTVDGSTAGYAQAAEPATCWSCAAQARYTVHPVADENCDDIDAGMILGSSDSLDAAHAIADEYSRHYAYGTAIRDAELDEIDFGAGFGVAVPDPAEIEA
jgi:hypothetical protein